MQNVQPGVSNILWTATRARWAGKDVIGNGGNIAQAFDSRPTRTKSSYSHGHQVFRLLEASLTLSVISNALFLLTTSGNHSACIVAVCLF